MLNSFVGCILHPLPLNVFIYIHSVLNFLVLYLFNNKSQKTKEMLDYHYFTHYHNNKYIMWIIMFNICFPFHQPTLHICIASTLFIYVDTISICIYMCVCVKIHLNMYTIPFLKSLNICRDSISLFLI